MLPSRIQKELCLLPPEGTYQEREYAKNQEPYLPLPALVTGRGTFVTMWMPSAGELALMQNGAPVTISILHTPYLDSTVPLSPMRVEVGGTDLR